MIYNQSANTGAKSTGIISLVILCLLGCIVIYSYVTFQDALKQAYAQLGVGPQTFNPPLREYEYKWALGLTIPEFKVNPKLTQYHYSGYSVSMWPDYICVFISTCHTDITCEMLVTKGTISAIRESSHYIHSNIYQVKTWIDANGNHVNATRARRRTPKIQAPANPDEVRANNNLAELYERARRGATNADAVLDRILAELPEPDEPPF